MKEYFDFFQELQTAIEHVPHDKEFPKNLLSAMSFFLQFKISERDNRDRFYLCPACNSVEIKTGADDLDIIPVKRKGVDLNIKKKEGLKYITTLTENLSRDDLFDILVDTYVSEPYAEIPVYKWFNTMGLFKNQDPIKKICFIHCDVCEAKKTNEESEKQNYAGQ